jgi:NitT/TauT family transport system substrate-binding protein
VAFHQGFFEKEGLRVTLKPYASGREAMAETIRGKASFCTVADTPVMFAGLKGERIRIVATIATAADYVRIVAHKNRGISRPGDLKGKTVAVTSGTSSEYYLYAFLTFNGMDEDDILVKDMSPDLMAHALVRREVDAAASWEPYLTEAQRALGNDAIVLSNNYIYKLDWNIAGMEEYIQKHPHTVVRLLRALIRATDYMAKNPGEARDLVSTAVGKGPVSLAGNEYDVHLGQSLLIDLENQARWAIRRKLTDRREVPDYLPMLYTEGLDKVRPEAITVIRR